MTIIIKIIIKCPPPLLLLLSFFCVTSRIDWNLLLLLLRGLLLLLPHLILAKGQENKERKNRESIVIRFIQLGAAAVTATPATVIANITTTTVANNLLDQRIKSDAEKWTFAFLSSFCCCFSSQSVSADRGLICDNPIHLLRKLWWNALDNKLPCPPAFFLQKRRLARRCPLSPLSVYKQTNKQTTLSKKYLTKMPKTHYNEQQQRSKTRRFVMRLKNESLNPFVPAAHQ